MIVMHSVRWEVLITDEVTAGVLRENNVINLPLLEGIETIIEEREVGLEAAVFLQEDLTKEEKEIHPVVL